MTTIREALEDLLRVTNPAACISSEAWVEAWNAAWDALAEQPAQAQLVRNDFERRMSSEGHSPSALSRLPSGAYLSPVVQHSWEEEKRKYAAQPAVAVVKTSLDEAHPEVHYTRAAMDAYAAAAVEKALAEQPAQPLTDEQTRKDAERYRWLLARRVSENDDGEKCLYFWCDFDHYDDVSAAIDEARAVEQAVRGKV